MVNTEDLQNWAEKLYEAEKSRQPISPMTDQTALTIDEAYDIQQRIIALKCQTGQHVVGKKIGLTSQAMQHMMGVDQPDFGHLMSVMAYSDGESIPLSRLIQPRLEAEIAFMLHRDLEGPGLTAREVLEATEYVVPCLEIVDSRIVDWRIALADTIADNASSGLYVVGNALKSPRSLDLDLVGMVLVRNGEVVQTSAGAAALGHPAYSVAWLANTLSEHHTPLRAGEMVLSGALGGAVPVKAEDYFVARFGGMGEVSCRFAAQSQKERR